MSYGSYSTFALTKGDLLRKQRLTRRNRKSVGYFVLNVGVSFLVGVGASLVADRLTKWRASLPDSANVEVQS